jgi:H+/gluconate symporter-like permease
MDIWLIVAIILSVVWIVFASLKRLSVLLSAPIATMIVIYIGRLDMLESMFGRSDSYITYLAGFVVSFFFIFVFGSIMAKYLQESGAIDTITSGVVKLIDVSNATHGMVAVFTITALLTYGGVSLFVVMFAVVPLAKSLFFQMKIPWKLAPLPIILGLGTFTASMLPGSPSIINIIPTQTLNTTLMAAPLIGIVTSIVTIASSIVYMNVVVKRHVNRQDHQIIERPPIRAISRPNLMKSLLPILTLITLIIIGSILNIPQVLTISLIIVIILEMFLYNHNISSHVDILNSGTLDALLPLLSTASTIAYGQFVANIGSVSQFTRKIIESSPSKLFMAALITVFFSLVTASASGAMGIIMQSQGEFLLIQEIPAHIIHRILAISTTILPNAPHSGVVIALLSLARLSHKESYKHVFLAPAICGTLALATGFLMSFIGIS